MWIRGRQCIFLRMPLMLAVTFLDWLYGDSGDEIDVVNSGKVKDLDLSRGRIETQVRAANRRKPLMLLLTIATRMIWR